MKFENIVIIIFLSGLLIYAACHRAGFIVNGSNTAHGTPSENARLVQPDSLRIFEWLFVNHPEEGLIVATECGEILHHIPEFRSSFINVEVNPDPKEDSESILYVRSDYGQETPCFRIMPNGNLEKLNDV